MICPNALDDAWKAKAASKPRWAQLARNKNILVFSKWNTKASGGQFAKLLKGLKIYFPPKGGEAAP